MDFSRVIAKLEKASEGFDGLDAQAGWFEQAQYEDGTKAAYVAAIQEFGAPEKNIPPRPFMRPAVEENKDYWIDELKNGVKAVSLGRMDADMVMDAIGQRMANDVQHAITKVVSPPLKQSTINARLRNKKDKTMTTTLAKPLEDTFYMIDNVRHAVIKDAAD